MSRRRCTKSGRRAASRRVVGASGVVAAFLAFGVVPFADPPRASADFGFDDLLDWFGLGDASDTGLGWFGAGAGAGAGAAPDGDLPDSAAFTWLFDGSALAEQFQTALWLPLHAQLEV
ncbi:hypothetical protein [Mycolicibacter minnesotensis]